MNREFPSGLVVRICCVHCGGLDSIPGQKTEIPQDTQCGARRGWGGGYDKQNFRMLRRYLKDGENF